MILCTIILCKIMYIKFNNDTTIKEIIKQTKV